LGGVLRTVSLSWDQDGGRFVALGSHADHPITVNAPRDETETRGATGFSATELLLAGAGACSAWDVVEILRKRRAQISSLDVAVEGTQQDDPPWSYARVALHFRVVGEHLTYRVMARIIRLSIVRYCSVISTIAAAAAIEATVELVGADGASTGRRPIELAIPSQPGGESGFTQSDIAAVGLPEPMVDEGDE
jgi:putative redox protein